jgi:hypothetical protein
MNDQNADSNDDSARRRRKPCRPRRIDVNPPYDPAPADAVEQFRKLLAELIARRLFNGPDSTRPSGDHDNP